MLPECILLRPKHWRARQKPGHSAEGGSTVETSCPRLFAFSHRRLHQWGIVSHATEIVLWHTGRGERRTSRFSGEELAGDTRGSVSSKSGGSRSRTSI